MPQFSRNVQYFYCEECKETMKHRQLRYPRRWECSNCGEEKEFKWRK